MTAQPAPRFRRPFRYVAVACAAFALAGCASKAAEGGDAVGGKVTLNGKPVAGQVVFVGGDRKEVVALIAPTGGYSLANLPRGEWQVFVRGTGLKVPLVPKGAAPPPGLTAAIGVAPPVRYAQPKHAQKFTFAGGAQTFDIELKP